MGTFWWSLGYTPPAPSASTRLYRVAILFLAPGIGANAAIVLLLRVAFFAGYLPARRASASDLIVALRREWVLLGLRFRVRWRRGQRRERKVSAEEWKSSHQINDRIWSCCHRSYGIISPYIGTLIVRRSQGMHLNHLK